MNTIFSIATAGLNSAMRQMHTAAAGIAGVGRPAVVNPMPIEQAVVTALSAKTAAAANTAVIRRTDEMLGRLLDVWA